MRRNLLIPQAEALADEKYVRYGIEGTKWTRAFLQAMDKLAKGS